MSGEERIGEIEDFKQKIEGFVAIRPHYEKYAEVLEKVLKKAAKKLAPTAIVQTRAKEVASFGEKIQRKREEYPDPLAQMTDLCGGRLITNIQSEIDKMSAFIEAHFELDLENCVSISQRLRPTEFGYRSVHYIVQFKRGVFPSRDIDIEVPEEVYGLKAEIQIRTLLEHVWADFSHERSYKSAFKIPEKWERELVGLAAMLENADNDFSRISEGLEAYAASYESYMSEAEIRREIGLLESVLAYDSGNAELAGRIGKLAIINEEWEKAIEVLEPHKDARNAAVSRDLGMVQCKYHRENKDSAEYRQGQQYLKDAIDLDPKDTDAICSLAGTWKGIDEDEVGRLYRQAFEIDATNPYVLGNHLEWQIMHANHVPLVACLSPIIKSSIERCRNQAAVGMNIPWTYYSRGLFHLLLEEPYESLSAYAKAVEVSSAAWMIATSLETLERLGGVRANLPGYEWVRRLLMLGLAARFPTSKKAEEIWPKLAKLVSPKSEPIVKPVVILAGGCDAAVEQQMQEYRSLLVEAFRGFEGTLIGGGTTAGISGVVGYIQEAYPDAIKTIGYVPKLTPAEISIDPKYKDIRRTVGNDFSAMEPLQNWIDLIASDIQSCDVRLLGVNGGKITAAEYRIALALGAKVAVIEESGREAAKLLCDEDWGEDAHLIQLPPEASTLSAFIVRGVPMLPADIRDIVAKAIHDTYRKNQADRKSPDDPAMAEWDELNEGLKESNRQQADHFLELLRWIGCGVHPVSDRAIVLMTFSEEEVEHMAELEHARWNEERLNDGWKFGPERDVENKISPYIVPWSKLADEIREYDRETVREIPELLKQVGLEINRV